MTTTTMTTMTRDGEHSKTAAAVQPTEQPTHSLLNPDGGTSEPLPDDEDAPAQRKKSRQSERLPLSDERRSGGAPPTPSPRWELELERALLSQMPRFGDGDGDGDGDDENVRGCATGKHSSEEAEADRSEQLDELMVRFLRVSLEEGGGGGWRSCECSERMEAISYCAYVIIMCCTEFHATRDADTTSRL